MKNLNNTEHLRLKLLFTIITYQRTTHDARQTTDDVRRKPLAMGHLSDSGDLKFFFSRTGTISVKLGTKNPWF